MIRTKYDLHVNNEQLSGGTLLRVIVENSQGARAVDPTGTIWIINPEDYDHVTG